jgi:hypothetical protein
MDIKAGSWQLFNEHGIRMGGSWMADCTSRTVGGVIDALLRNGWTIASLETSSLHACEGGGAPHGYMVKAISYGSTNVGASFLIAQETE